MNFEALLDRAFSTLTVLQEQSQEEFIPRTAWMTSDPEVLKNIARTKSRSVFWNNLAKLLFDAELNLVGLPVEIRNTINGKRPFIKKENRGDEILRLARREARRYYNERQATASPGMRRSLGQSGLEPDKLGLPSAQEVATGIAKPAKKYAGDSIYSVYRDDELVQDNFITQDEAEAFIRQQKEPNYYEVRERENPKSLKVLMNTKLPLQNGWTADEVVHAMRPIVFKMAGKYAGLRVPKEDLAQIGYIGILDAIRTDKGEAPFVYYATKNMRGQMARAARTGGVIKGPDKSVGGRGVLTGYNVVWIDENDKPHMQFFPADVAAYQKTFSATGRAPARTNDPNFKKAQEMVQQLKSQGITKVDIFDERSNVTSGDKPMSSDEGGESSMAGLYRSRIPAPHYIASQTDYLRELMKKAQLSPQQQKAIEVAYGMDVPEASITQKGFRSPESGNVGRKPGEQAGIPATKPVDMPGVLRDLGVQRDPNQVADILGISYKRARDQMTNALAKLQKASSQMRYEDLLRCALGLVSEERVERVTAFDRFLGEGIVRLIFAGEFNEVLCS